MTKFAAMAFVLFLIFAPAWAAHSHDEMNDRIVWAEGMTNEKMQPGLAFTATGQGNHVFQVAVFPPDPVPCSVALDTISADHEFVGILYARGFRSVVCISERNGNVQIIQKDIGPLPQPKPLPKPSPSVKIANA